MIPLKKTLIAGGIGLGLGILSYSSYIATSQTSSVSSQQKTVVVQKSSKLVQIKYRPDAVDVANSRFEYTDTSNSSFIRGAWYDATNEYMIISLNGTYYQYCSLPQSIWEGFQEAESFGSYYNYAIKGNYDCRNNPVPTY